MSFRRGDPVRIRNIENTSQRIQCNQTQRSLLWTAGIVTGFPKEEFVAVLCRKNNLTYVWHESSLEIDHVKVNFK